MIKYKINMQEKDILVIPAKASFFGCKLAFKLLELELDLLQLVFREQFRANSVFWQKRD